MNDQDFSNRDVFISYRHANKDLVAPVEEEFKRRGVSYFIDREGINYGMAYSEVISRAINACKVLLFFWTPESNNSKDMLREAQMALDYEKTIVPYKIGDFDVKEHRSLHYIMAPYSRYDVPRQTHETVVEIVNRVQSYLTDVQPSSNETQFELNYRLAQQGDAEAQAALGYYYSYGVSKNETEAVYWYFKAAEQGLAEAQKRLGECYADGLGVPMDESEAVKWYRKAAEQGLAEAQCKLGFCYFNGSGILTDKTEAVKWFRKAAEQGLDEAQYCLGLCYYTGIGVQESSSEAMTWFRKAADQGHEGALLYVRKNG